MRLRNKKENMATRKTWQILIAWCLSSFGVSVSADPSPETLSKLQQAVFKITSERGSGTIQVGSAVLVAENKLVTNCHVLSWAKKIHVLRDGERWLATLVAADKEHDLCLLSAPGVAFAPVNISQQLAIGQEVHAAGFPGGGNFNVSCGAVRALHDYDSAKVIQTNANFIPGSSGGGLFDNDGNLVGILTFRAVSGGDFHFVMPASWVESLLSRADSNDQRNAGSTPFYQRNPSSQPFFLQAAYYESQQNWAGLLDIAQRWSSERGADAESWMAVGKACTALNKKDQAISAFQTVLALDAQHSLGKDWLQSILPPNLCAAGDPSCVGGNDLFAFMEPVLP